MTMLWATGRWTESAFWGIMYAAATGILFGCAVSAAGGLAVTTLALPLFGFMWSGHDTLLYDMAAGPGYGILFGWTVAVVIYVTTTIGSEDATITLLTTALRQLGGFLLALAMSVRNTSLFPQTP